MDFTKEQREAIISTEGNVCCIASAGSGKTASFTTRIAYMIQQKQIDSSNIMAITFTNKASEEMINRLNKMVGKKQVERLTIGTMHSVFYRLLRKYDSDISKYKIAPDWWKFSIISDICSNKTSNNPNGLGLGEFGLKPFDLSFFISHQKNNMIGHLEDILIDEDVDFVRGIPENLLQEAYIKYEVLKDNTRQIDFDDVLKLTYDKMIEDEDFRSKMSEQFKYIMIDEYQDTSEIAKEIVKLINDKNVFAVGDFRQSIYGFINAKIENILNFSKDFKDAKIIELNSNFRSSQKIVEFSNRIISNSHMDEFSLYKPSISVSDEGEDIELSAHENERAQAYHIVNKIREMKGVRSLKEIAILFRASSLTSTVEDVFIKEDIPYEVNRSTSFFDRKEVLDIVSYMRLISDSTDDESLRRIYNTPNRYLSKKFIYELESFASNNDMSLYEAMKKTPHNKEWKYKSNIDKIIKIIEPLRPAANENAGRLLRRIIHSTKYEDYLRENTTSKSLLNERLDALDRLCKMAVKFPNARAFEAHMISVQEKKRKNKNKDAVQLVTMHSSKGLEWDSVFVINVNDDVIPHEMSGLTESGIEEERRVFYVACSRARHSLHISWIVQDEDSNVVSESRFIKEMSDINTKEISKGVFSNNGSYAFPYNPLN